MIVWMARLVRGRLVPDYNPRSTSQSPAEYRAEQSKRVGAVVERDELRVGDRVRAPEYVLEDGAHRKFRAYWGINPPTELTVRRVDHREGEIELVADDGQSMDPNIEDLPLRFERARKR